ncbi:DUF2804 domain-containing protein [Streptosporangium carneum]|uniref:DUF2804 domain-containing protein n=1 Tax=Streptosporangium carneum TaxID=47481 RepID=A0A9W6IB30_9ACTN|nr:DUF2804 domain-containing protein [Streptosporangium carneum]GLK14781.1 hypothetical protein GCM10017600_81930 [Streptosporangium carneum]
MSGGTKDGAPAGSAGQNALAKDASRRVVEREITGRVDLCRPDGRLNPAAVGWSRTPLHRANIRGWGRTMRWEYWCLTSPEHVFAFSASSLDYLASEAAWYLDRTTRRDVSSRSLIVPSRGTSFSERSGEGSVRIGRGPLRIAVDETADGTRLRLKSPEFDADLLVHRVEGRDSLAVVVPWSSRRFQYTVKDLGRPAEGTLVVNGRRIRLSADDTLATLDHGRGRWPGRVLWNWGAAAGRSGGREVGVQIGGKWTDGTGSVENGLFLDGRLHKISEELVWRYDTSDWMAPWRILGERVDLEFVPEHVRSADVTRLYLHSREDQAFGHYRGTVVADDGTVVEIDDLYGWAEEVCRRW